MKKTTTAIRLDNHEKLCRIMQKQTHAKINELAVQINRLEKMFRPGGKLDTAITSIGGESDAPAIQEALANAYDYLEDGHQNAMGHIHDK